MKLIYCSFSVMYASSEPDWVEKIRSHGLVREKGWGVWSPWLSFDQNLSSLGTAQAITTDHMLPSRKLKEAMSGLGLDQALLAPLREVVDRIHAAEANTTVDIQFKALYALARSDVVLADLTDQSVESQELLYARAFGIPVIGITDRFIMSPWVVNSLSSVVFAKSSDDVMRQVLAYDHMVTSMLRPPDRGGHVNRDLEDIKAKLAERDQETEEH